MNTIKNRKLKARSAMSIVEVIVGGFVLLLAIFAFTAAFALSKRYETEGVGEYKIYTEAQNLYEDFCLDQNSLKVSMDDTIGGTLSRYYNEEAELISVDMPGTAIDYAFCIQITIVPTPSETDAVAYEYSFTIFDGEGGILFSTPEPLIVNATTGGDT